MNRFSAEIHPTAHICNGAVLGKPFRRLLDGSQDAGEKAILNENAYIGYYSIIGSGSIIGSNVIIDDYSIIESDVIIGRRSLVIYRAQICNEARIGEECVIGGFVGERAVIGNRCRIFGKLIHPQHNPCIGWDDESAIEESPIVSDEAFIGFNAVVVGGVKIGRRAYVCAGAVVTKDVPDCHVAYHTNRIIMGREWNGKLRESEFFNFGR